MYVSLSNNLYNTRNTNDIPLIHIKHNFFRNTFFRSKIFEWNKLNPGIQNSSSFNGFKESIVDFIKPASSSILEGHNLKGIQYLTRLWVTFSHFRDHKLNTRFKTLLIHFALVAWKQKQQIISYSTVPITKTNAVFHIIKSSTLDKNENNTSFWTRYP